MNRCPLGSCAITGTGFPIDRPMVADLLAFDGPTGNTHAGIGATDYVLEAASSVMVLLSMLGRVLQDLLLWSTTQFRFLRLDDEFVQSSSIMPQKRNPVSLEHARAHAGRGLGQSTAIFQMLQNTPFGDIVDAEDDLQPLVARAMSDTRHALELTAAALESATFDRERLLASAREGWITATDLADRLASENGIPFRQAHQVTARTIRLVESEGIAPGEALERASETILGRKVTWSDRRMEELLCPMQFVLRRQTPGGPNPLIMEQTLVEAEARIEADQHEIDQARTRFSAYRQPLRQQ